MFTFANSLGTFYAGRLCKLVGLFVASLKTLTCYSEPTESLPQKVVHLLLHHKTCLSTLIPLVNVQARVDTHQTCGVLSLGLVGTPLKSAAESDRRNCRCWSAFSMHYRLAGISMHVLRSLPRVIPNEAVSPVIF